MFFLQTIKRKTSTVLGYYWTSQTQLMWTVRAYFVVLTDKQKKTSFLYLAHNVYLSMVSAMIHIFPQNLKHS